MSASQPRGSVLGADRLAAGEPRVGDRPAAHVLATRTVGVIALAATVCAAVWIAAGAAGDRYLLQLPTSANPLWIDGPLRALRGVLEPLGPDSLSAALIVMSAGYVIALACARAIPLRLALGAVVLSTAAFTLGPTLVSTDVFGYIAYAREIALHGLNPYVVPPSAIAHDGILQFVYWKQQTSPYGPLFTLGSFPLGLLSAGTALWVYKLGAGVLSIAIAWLVATLARDRGLNPARATIFVGLNPVLLFYATSGAHNDLLGSFLVLCAFGLLIRRHASGAAATAVAAAAVKLTLGLALPFVLIGARRGRDSLRGAGLALVAIGVPTLVVFGPHFIDQLGRIVSDHQFDTAFSGPDLLATALGTSIDGLIRALCTGGAALVVVIALLRALRGADPITAAGWAFLALLASIASLAPWYLVWVLPLAALSRSRALMLATLITTLYLIVIHLPALGGQPWLSQAAS